MRGSKVAQKTTPIYISQDPEILRLKRYPSLKNKIKSLLYTGCFSLSPIKPSIELGRSVVAMLKENFFLKYLILFIPALKGEAFISCKNLEVKLKANDVLFSSLPSFI